MPSLWTTESMLSELVEWLRIPSVSTGEPNLPAIREAAGWACQRIIAAGGTAEVIEDYGHPLGVGELRSGNPDAPVVLAYGHVDVQAPGPLELWDSPPFDPQVRDGRVYARGASDDKGIFFPLLHAACVLARADDLPVHVRFLLDGEEEAFGDSASRWLADQRRPDCAIVFDGGMVDESTPAMEVSFRGIVMVDIEVRTGSRDLHSGSFGGSALNAAHALHRMLAPILPDANGVLREELRAGLSSSSPSLVTLDERLPPGADVLADAGAEPLYASAADDYYFRNVAEPSLDVNAMHCGEPRTVLPTRASAAVSQRLGPGQSSERIAAVLTGLLSDAAPQGAAVDIGVRLCDPAVFSPHDPALRLAAAALTRVTGTTPIIRGTGGTNAIMSTLAALEIPTVHTGFGVPDDAEHAPNESYRLEALELGASAASELYSALASLNPRRDEPDAESLASSGDPTGQSSV